ncbi:MAG: type II secretion system protein GspC, partial [Myxococcales bacterium]|nr:hypothetical protein [Polyangiaceae bacterium]MDW8251308.1 type II secretion system protein GspC [Myxococcales bacterium]
AFDAILKRYFPVVILALVAVAAYFQASGITQIVGTALAVDDKGLLAGGPAPLKVGVAASSSYHQTSAAKIIERNPLDSVVGNLNPPLTASATTAEEAAPPPLPATGDPYGAPACEGNHKIVTTAVSSDAAWSFALLFDGSTTKMVRQGSDYGDKKVWFIRWDRVWLIGANTFCQIEMFPMATPDGSAKSGTPAAKSAPTAAPPPPPGAPAAVPEDIKKSIQKVSATEYNVDRSAIDKILENQQLLMRSARIVPETENGKTVGIRLFGVRPDSLLGLIGIENGDRLERINGFDVASPEKALEAYARLRSADRLTVQVNRRGQPTTLDFHIK